MIEYRLPDVAEPEVSEETLARGNLLFFERCSWCHGYGAVGNGSFPDLRFTSESNHSIWNSILLEGAYLSKGMPSFEGVLTEEDAQAIRAYVIRQGRMTTESQ